MLSKTDILKQATKLKTAEVEVPEWGGKVLLREMTGATRDEFDDFMASKPAGSQKEIRARLLVACIVDENGKQMFTDLDVPDLLQLSSKNIRIISQEAMRLSGLDSEWGMTAVKNSDAVLNEDSGSDSVES